MYRERETERERQECIYSLPLAYTNKIRERSLSLSLVSRTSAHKLIPLSFIIDRYIPFVAWKRTRERSILHSLRLLFTRAPSARYCALPPPPPPIYLSLAPISSPSFVPFSQFAPCPRGIATHPARLNLGNRCRIYFTRYQGTPATHSTEHSHGIGIPRAAERSGWGGGEEKRGKGKRRRRSLVVSVIVKSAEAKGDNRYLSALSLSLPSPSLCKSVSETRARASAHRGQKGREKRSGSVSTHDVAYCNEATVH